MVLDLPMADVRDCIERPTTGEIHAKSELIPPVCICRKLVRLDGELVVDRLLGLGLLSRPPPCSPQVGGSDNFQLALVQSVPARVALRFALPKGKERGPSVIIALLQLAGTTPTSLV
eukprot:scpid39550/ scgid9508/ 